MSFPHLWSRQPTYTQPRSAWTDGLGGRYLWVARVGFRQLLTSYGLRSTLGPGSSGSTGWGHQMQDAVGLAGLIIPFRAKDHNNITERGFECHPHDTLEYYLNLVRVKGPLV